jgi:hypothetical protein
MGNVGCPRGFADIVYACQHRNPLGNSKVTKEDDDKTVTLRVFRSDGGVGSYTQTDPRKAVVLVGRLKPESVFNSGVIIIGTLNPLTLINPDNVAWIEAETAIPLPQWPVAGVERVVKLANKAEFDELLLQQWPRWRQMRRSRPGDMLQSLVELTFLGGRSLYLHVHATVVEEFFPQTIFSEPCITATLPEGGALYVNPKALMRMRIYHSSQALRYPDGIFMAEANEI